MKEYKSEFLRNVALVSHGGAGKTSIAEAILFNTGANSRQGKVDDGSSLLDFEDEEKRRKLTSSTSIAPVEWQECKINVLDTPGFADFIGDVCGAMRAADGVVVTVCAASGVEVSTEKVWQLAAEQNLPRIVFVNKMDRENADFNKVLEQLKSTFGGVFAPVVLPIGSESSFKGIVDLIDRKAFVRENAAAGFVEASPIPDYMADDVELARTMLIEAAAEGDDLAIAKRPIPERRVVNEAGKSIVARSARPDGQRFGVALTKPAGGGFAVQGDTVNEKHQFTSIVARDHIVPVGRANLGDGHHHLRTQSRFAFDANFTSKPHFLRALIEVVGKEIEYEPLMSAAFAEKSTRSPKTGCRAAHSN